MNRFRHSRARRSGDPLGETPAARPTPTVEWRARVVLDALRGVVRQLRLTAREAEGRVGLSAAQLFVLHKLADGRALSLGALAERTLTHPSSVSVVVARLVARGLVSRVPSRDDARRVELGLTPAGRALIARAPDVAQDRVIGAVRRLPARDRDALARGLAALIREMGVAEAAPGMLFEDESPPAPVRRPRC